MKTGTGKRRLLAMLLAALLLLTGITPAAAAGGVAINKESLTISSGNTYQLSVTVNGTAAAAAAWGSSDASVATVSQNGLVTGKAAGSAIITAMVNGTTVECLVTVLKKTVDETVRYNVLILDASGSMRGTPDISQKAAAKQFCSKVLSTSGQNYVAVVSMSTTGKTICGFSQNYKALSNYIDSIVCTGDTNIEKALSVAGSLLNGKKSGSNVMKNVILCSDGLPTTGLTASSGRYTAADHKWYKFANAAYNTDTVLKKKNYFIYALGFFHSSTGNELKFGKRLMKDLASKDKYYIIQDSSDIKDVFEDIADTITKTTMSKSAVTLKVGSTYQLNALVNGVKKNASWKSSASSVASVSSSGKITAKKAGTAVITATVNGKSVTCKVTVQPTVKLNKTSATLSVGEKIPLKATVKGTSSKVTWKSSKSSIASVSSSGVVTAKKAGKTVISASVGGTTAKCTITVKKATHPLYSVYFKFNKKKYGSTSSWKYIDEEGDRLVLNDDAVIEKCGAYVKKSGGYWYITLAFKGTNITSARISAYVSYNGKIVEDGMTSSRLNTFSVSKDSKGIWSMYGRYADIRYNVNDIYGHNVVDVSAGKQGANTKLFTDLNKMKEWLAS